MSFVRTKEFIEERDTVVLYLNPQRMHSVEVLSKVRNKKGETVDQVFQTIYGALKVDSLIGKRYGTKVALSKGWAYVLQPTPELWSVTLPHRTQIIYTPDASLIAHLLDLSPGKIVVEAGTGSASFSHSLIRTIRPHGHLYTFDFHEERVGFARDEFAHHGLSEFVDLAHRDVCREGFGDELEGRVDAIFLDLPHPWLTIDHAVKTLKKSGGKLCSFSPCIEQVQQTCERLLATGFIAIKTTECLQRELTVLFKNVPRLDLDCLKHRHSEAENTMRKAEQSSRDDDDKILTVTHAPSTPGHTGYITIATLPPLNVRFLPEDADLNESLSEPSK